MLAREIYSHINFGLDYIRDENAGKRELYNKMFEVLNDRLLLSKFFSAFSAAGKEDFGKAAKELTRMSRDVLEGDRGSRKTNQALERIIPNNGSHGRQIQKQLRSKGETKKEK